MFVRMGHLDCKLEMLPVVPSWYREPSLEQIMSVVFKVLSQ